MAGDPQTTVVQAGSGAVATSTMQICFSGVGSSFQWAVMQIMKQLSSSCWGSGTSPVPRPLWVSVSQATTRVGSLARRGIFAFVREAASRFSLGASVSTSGRRPVTGTRKRWVQSGDESVGPVAYS